MMHLLLKELRGNEALQCIQKGKHVLGNLSLTEEALLLAQTYREHPQTMFIIKNTQYTAQRLHERLCTFVDDEVLLFSIEESLRVEAIASSPESKAMQMEVMSKLIEDTPRICVMNAAAAIRYVPSAENFQSHCIHMVVKEEISYDQLKVTLTEAGYTHVNHVDQPLCFATRGGIIDIYSMNYENPVRIEFFDNEIDSIRFFDISTQRTKEIVQEVTIIPATDLLYTKDEIREIVENVTIELQKQATILSQQTYQQLQEYVNNDLDDITNFSTQKRLYNYHAFLEKNDTILQYVEKAMVIISNKEEVESSIHHIIEENVTYIQEQYQEGKALLRFHVFADLYQSSIQHRLVEFTLFLNHKNPISSQIMTTAVGDINLERTMQEIITESRNSRVLLCLQEAEIKQIKHLLDEAGMPYKTVNEEDTLTIGIQFIQHELMEGFRCMRENIRVYTSKELFHTTKLAARYRNKFKEAEVLHNYQELHNGDYIVHNQHGVGKYLGIVNKVVDGTHKDFLHIVYKGDDALLVPLEQFRLIRKFVSREGASPRLNRLGSNEWEKTKKKVSQSVAEMADRLVCLYAQRDENIGYAYPKDGELQKQFDSDFEYELTHDQIRAVKEIKQDMEKNKPMDRLLCGDVGFGKTEVAARAAFKAVIAEKQVAFLCPTTILSLQHLQTFKKRYRNFPVRIEVINRFIKVSDQKRIIKDVKEGFVDILIGTHRLLSKDIIFKDLGLLIIDEEQRFGVEHKEKIKELKQSVDVLSLSATPIPRTLQMSLIGIRSLSQLNTPPQNRMPVQTYVIEKNFAIVKEIIQRELGRNGQVFYLFNNVQEIYNVASAMRKALPDVEIGVAHGKMARDDIEDVMIAFTNNQYQVLICTTIIETGIDIPNANTIIIENADCFGLSQLYQIKGRVGRSDRLAYAYLMYAPQKNLSEKAMKRLRSIKEFTQLGSGYKIAMRDLTIRGAGDMLGPQQAGFIDTVGIDMYIEMLNSAIMEKKGIVQKEKRKMVKANAKVDAYLPMKFAQEDYEKIKLYQRIDALETKHDLLEMMEELNDTYGRLPKAVKLLFEKKRLDICINEPHVDEYNEKKENVEITFSEGWSNEIDGVQLFEMMTTISKSIHIEYKNKKIKMRMPKQKDWLYTLIEVLERTSTFLS